MLTTFQSFTSTSLKVRIKLQVDEIYNPHIYIQLKDSLSTFQVHKETRDILVRLHFSSHLVDLRPHHPSSAAEYSWDMLERLAPVAFDII